MLKDRQAVTPKNKKGRFSFENRLSSPQPICVYKKLAGFIRDACAEKNFSLTTNLCGEHIAAIFFDAVMGWLSLLYHYFSFLNSIVSCVY